MIETLLFLLLVPGFGWAKSPQDDWDNLKQLVPGEKIQVVDSKMKTLKGTFVSVSDEAISLQVGKNEESVLRANVVRVSVRDPSHRARNMAWPAGVIGGIALIPSAIVIGQQSNEGNTCTASVAAIAAGFGGGAALGAIPGSRTIYRVKKQRTGVLNKRTGNVGTSPGFRPWPADLASMRRDRGLEPTGGETWIDADLGSQ